MTLRAISIAPNNYENPIESDRTLFDTLARRVAGVVFEDFSATQTAAPELKVVPGTGHTVKVQPGKCVIREKSNPQWRGGYWFTNDADEVVNLPVPESNPFIATVIARVADPQYGAVTGAVGPRIDVVSGTPASNPVAVSDVAIDALTGTPGGWKRLSDVRINTADTGAIPAGQFTDRRTPGGFGAINCWSSNRPAITGSGVEIYEMDTKRRYQWDGTAWEYLGGGTPPTYFHYHRKNARAYTSGLMDWMHDERTPNHPAPVIGSFDIATGLWTCGQSGIYEIQAKVRYRSNAAGQLSYAIDFFNHTDATTVVNGADHMMYVTGGNYAAGLVLSEKVHCVSGKKYKIRGWSDASSNTIEVGPEHSYFSGVKVG